MIRDELIRKLKAKAGKKGMKKRYGKKNDNSVITPVISKHESEDENVIESENIIVPPTKKLPNPYISQLIDYFKEKLDKTLDGTVKDNRNFSHTLIRQVKKDYKMDDTSALNIIKLAIDKGFKDNFHSKNITSIAYLYRNFNKINQLDKKDAKKSRYHVGEQDYSQTL